MDFGKAYNRKEFVSFLRDSFLPEDFLQQEENVILTTRTQYTRSAVKLGTCASLDLVVYEVRHCSLGDARVGLSKEAFRLLADEMEDRALVVFVPEDSNKNYRFSFIEIKLELDDARVARSFSNPRRYSFMLGEGIAYYTPNKYLNEKGRVTSDEDLHSRFSVEVLTKEFYNELSDWYAWAIKIIRFPNDINTTNDDQQYNHEGAIRLITRLIFVWFLKQRGLIPWQFFDEAYIRENLIADFNPNVLADLFYKSNESKYYKAILQNLFFAMLNCPITKEGRAELTERKFKEGRSGYDDNKLMRYKSLFSNPDLFLELANKTVPFLNGGLFDCLDDKQNGMYYDGFSERTESQKQLCVPDFLFFGEEVGKNIDLSEWYGDKNKKKVSARGIIDILKRYNFTVEENMPFDKDVSLDPELLGKVFENLLAAYNPETQQTARKQTGSFYTPREIVQYMVDESLVAHLKRTVGEHLEAEYRKLLSYSDEEISLTATEKRQIMHSLLNCKILDPACGSGAFPVGILQQMVHILTQIDPDNSQWKEMLLNQAISETSEAYRNASSEERAEMVADIERSFDESVNRPDYARKLYLIENCIFGVDIQPIAIQISKLRFFISLVVDQKINDRPADNFGIRPLPNLEAKFVAANSLIGLQGNLTLADSAKIVSHTKQQLKTARHKIFSARTSRTKQKYKQQVNDLRESLAQAMLDLGFVNESEARQLAAWDMFDQNASSPFFDPDWMFGVKEGFDIVIANPPYVEFKNLSASIKATLTHYLSTKGKYDLYIPFIERASVLSTKGGCITYICPTRFTKRDYGTEIRKYIRQNLVLCKFVDFKDSQVFENALTYTGVFIFKKSKQDDYTIDYLTINEVSVRHSVSCTLFNSETYGSSILSSQTWDFNTFQTDGLLNKIRAGSVTIESVTTGISQGVATGKDDVFLVDSDTIVKYGMEKDILHKFLKGKDISSYNLKWSGKYIIYPYNEEGCVISEKILSEKYPRVYAYLVEKRDSLKGRGYFDKSAKRWYELWNQRKLNRFIGEKIVTLDNAKRNSFCLDADNYLGTTTVYSIKSDSVNLYYLLGLLNSRLLTYYHQHTTIPQANGFFRYQAIFIKGLPIKISETQQPIISLVTRILSAKRENPQADTTAEEREIDLLVYRLYGLTYDEVLVIDPETDITKEEYNNAPF